MLTNTLITNNGFQMTTGFILGLFEGDGSVLISVSVKPDNLTGFRCRLSFNIYLHEKDKMVLDAVKAYLGVGIVEFSNKGTNGDVYRYTVRNLRDLSRIIVPLLMSQPAVLGKRFNDIRLFLQAVDLMLTGVHTTHLGLARFRALDAQLSGKMNRLEKCFLPQPMSPITPE